MASCCEIVVQLASGIINFMDIGIICLFFVFAKKLGRPRLRSVKTCPSPGYSNHRNRHQTSIQL